MFGGMVSYYVMLHNIPILDFNLLAIDDMVIIFLHDLVNDRRIRVSDEPELTVCITESVISP